MNSQTSKEKILEPYRDLMNRYAEISQFSSGISLLHWDTKTYMPPRGIQQRGKVLGTMSKFLHKLLTSPKIGDLIKECKKIEEELDFVQKRNLFLIERAYKKAVALPEDLVVELTRQQTYTEHIWEEAKRTSNFSKVKEELAKLIELTRKKAEYIDPDKDPYNILIDDFEPNLTQEEITQYFTPLREGVKKLIEKYQSKKDSFPSPSILHIPVAIQKQKEISKEILKFLNLDPDRSRLDESEHPFTIGYADDVRITTHYLENDPTASLYSVMHEAGHALYDMNLPRDHLWEPISEGASYGIHESQSRFTENIVGKSKEFLEYFYPILCKIEPAFKNISQSTFTQAINAIVPSKIRIYADEVTYNLHIILRFEIERELFAERVTVEELPQLWNEKMELYLNQKIENDAEGVLQDTHWYGGAFGYFPSYALGNIFNGQMLATLKKDLPSYKEQIVKGDFKEILQWLRKNVHEKGALYDPADLIMNITGEKPNPAYFLDYLNEKYSIIFSL